jgi:hypothetical protein
LHLYTYLYVKQNIHLVFFFSYLYIFLAVLKLVLTKQNKIVKQNEIIMAKITNLEKQVSSRADILNHRQLGNQTKQKLYETFIIKTVDDLQKFDACLKNKKFFDEVVIILILFYIQFVQ